MRIILSGGGTLGSVSPLIAIYEKLKEQNPDFEFLWIGSKYGPEHKLVKEYQIIYKPIMTSKFRRYFSLKNIVDLFIFPCAAIQSFFILRKYRPNLIMSAGSFVSVPLVWAAWPLRIPCVIHQQDVLPGLANKLMSPFVKLITITFKSSASAFSKEKVVLTGNPIRKEMLNGNREKGVDIFHLDKNLPTVLVLGGGTGAYKINQLVLDSLQELVNFCQIIHLTGAGKTTTRIQHSRYHDYDFISKDLKFAYAAADLVVTRAGLSTLTELSILKKPAIIIPIPASHQVNNAIEFGKNNAAVVLDQEKLNKKVFVSVIKDLLSDKVMLDNLSRNIGKMMPNDATQKIINLISLKLKK